jgi:hypothetical protein
LSEAVAPASAQAVSRVSLDKGVFLMVFLF